jgi:hypothetical protein
MLNVSRRQHSRAKSSNACGRDLCGRSIREPTTSTCENEAEGDVTRRAHATAATLLAALVLLHLPADAATQGSTQPANPDVQKLGPQVGSRVPDFTLTDQRGQSRTLASLMGPNGLMLVFFRSADW